MEDAPGDMGLSLRMLSLVLSPVILSNFLRFCSVILWGFILEYYQRYMDSIIHVRYQLHTSESILGFDNLMDDRQMDGNKDELAKLYDNRVRS